MLIAALLSIGTTSCAYAATSFVFLFQIFPGIGYLPIPRFYLSEVTTTHIRSKGQAFGGFINWMCVFCVVQITPVAIDNIGWRVFVIFACFCAVWILVVYFFFPGMSIMGCLCSTHCAIPTMIRNEWTLTRGHGPLV